MPAPLIPILAAGAQLAGAGMNALSQGNMNKKNREHQEYMFDKTNAYNTPQMQMQRFKEAGLNPHLIYGQGNSGNTSMPSNPDTKAPEYDFGSAMMSYVATKKQQTEIDNLETAKEVMEADKTLKAAQTQATLSSSAKTDQEVDHASRLFETVSAQANANLKNTELTAGKIGHEIDQLVANTNLTKENAKLSQSQQAKISQDIKESLERIKTLRVERENKRADTELKQLELKLRRLGINPNDPAWMRITTQAISDPNLPEKVGNGIRTIGKGIYDWFTK